MKSWKTTILGVLTIATAVFGAVMALIDGNPATNPNWETLIAAITAGIGLIAAKDSNVTGGTVANGQTPAA